MSADGFDVARVHKSKLQLRSQAKRFGRLQAVSDSDREHQGVTIKTIFTLSRTNQNDRKNRGWQEDGLFVSQPMALYAPGDVTFTRTGSKQSTS
ncbi:hypothetical protein PM082_021793 [Marasmius tenuissimus]|nr:hypothetical protein PM082_021793 [Marasmius tenuissimus]